MARFVAFVIASIFFLIPCEAQHVGSKHLVIYTANMQRSAQQIEGFLDAHQARVKVKNDAIREHRYTFNISREYLGSLDSLAKMIGNVVGNNLDMSNLKERIQVKENNIENLKYESNLYNKLLLDTLSSGFRGIEIRQKLANNARMMLNDEVDIFKLKKELENDQIQVNIELNDEQSVPEGTRVHFVNMPGLEYGFLLTENPKPGVSLKAYQGATIKYMFTRGKSYLNVGVYKGASNLVQDSSAVNELFVINVGQDFYPRHFGRGNRKYLNLYTGYQAGGIILHQKNDKNTRTIWNANLSLGLELYKTKHILIDNKVSYFLPLNSINHDLRGMLYQAAINFVF